MNLLEDLGDSRQLSVSADLVRDKNATKYDLLSWLMTPVQHPSRTGLLHRLYKHGERVQLLLGNTF